MKYCRNVLETIGRTPLIQMSKVAQGLPGTLLAKVEYFNPGGSVKDRIALRMIEDAERRGLLRPGGTMIEATAGKVDVFVAGMGTGGTISGTGQYLKGQNPGVVVVGVDPAGSILSGDAPKSYKVEGVGEDFIPATFDRQAVDDMVRVTDAEAFAMTRRLAREEGLLVGGSAGMAVAGAIKFARRLPPDKMVVVLLPDTGRNYLGKIFSDAWMQQNGFPFQAPESSAAGQILDSKKTSSSLIIIAPDQPAAAALQLMEDNAISQIPVLQDGRCVGSLNEVTLLELLHDGVNLRQRKVAAVMGLPLPQVEATTDVAEVYRYLMAGYSGVIVAKNGQPHGLLARIDLADFWARKAGREAAAP